MNILKLLEPIRREIAYKTVGDIMRETRDLIGMKQWRLAQLLGITPNAMKNYEFNRFSSVADKMIFVRFCELFDYELGPIWEQVVRECEKTGHRVHDGEHHPYYEHKRAWTLKSSKNKCKLNLPGHR